MSEPLNKRLLIATAASVNPGSVSQRELAIELIRIRGNIWEYSRQREDGEGVLQLSTYIDLLHEKVSTHTLNSNENTNGGWLYK